MTNPNSCTLKHFDFSRTQFLKSATCLLQSPLDVGTEIAFVGRSNAGKSSAINTITGKNGLARTSKTPGRTQLINFFQIDEKRRLVDLPGYGYAKVPNKIHHQIEQLLNEYLSHRHCLRGLILLMDIRHALTQSDQRLIDFAHQCQLPVHILLTKCDKLKRGAAQAVLLRTQSALQGHSSVQIFSALRRNGIEQARQKLEEWLSDPT